MPREHNFIDVDSYIRQTMDKARRVTRNATKRAPLLSAHKPEEGRAVAAVTHSTHRHLLKLPLEIRQIIWEYALTPTTVNYCDKRDHTDPDHQVCIRPFYQLAAPRGDPLGLVCLQVREDLKGLCEDFSSRNNVSVQAHHTFQTS